MRKLMALILLLSLAGCGADTSLPGETASGSSVDSAAETVYEPVPLPEPTDRMTVYTMSMTSYTLTPAVNIFRERYPEVTVEVVNIGDEEYGTLLATELAAGQGPDLVFSFGAELPDLYKTVSTGVFADLNNFILSDEDFDLGEYVTEVMDGGMFAGKRAFLPVEYGVPLLTTTQEILDNAGLTPEDFEDYDGFLRSMEAYSAFCDGEQYPFVDLGLEPTRFALQYFLKYGGLELIDYETRTLAIDKEAFRKVLDTLRKIAPGSIREDSGVASSAGIKIMGEALTQAECLFNNYHSGANSTFFYERATVASHGQTPLVFVLPDCRGGVTADILSIAAIPTGSENQRNAWRLLKILLSAEIQGGYDQSAGSLKYLRVGNPVHMESLRERIRIESWGAVSDAEVEEYFAKLTDVRDAKMLQTVLYDFVCEEMLPYLQGDEDFEACYKRLTNILGIYKDE